MNGLFTLFVNGFKREAVKLVKASGLSIAEDGRQLSIPPMTLTSWVYRIKNPKLAVDQAALLQNLKLRNPVCVRNWHIAVRIENEIINGDDVLCEGVAARYATIKRL